MRGAIAILTNPSLGLEVLPEINAANIGLVQYFVG
jgi:hypothetical protein